MNQQYKPPESSLSAPWTDEGRYFTDLKVYITIREIVKVAYFAHSRNRFLWGLSIFLGLVIYAVDFIGLWAMGFPLASTFETMGMFLVWVLIVNSIGFVFGMLPLILSPSWRKGRVGEHLISCNEEGIIEETHYNRTQVKWSSVNAVSKRWGSILFMFSGADVFSIPKETFEDEADWDRVYNILAGNAQRAKST